MSWMSLISTVVGALIGIGSTLVADRARYRRELAKADRDARRQLYADFLIADAAAHDGMRLQAMKAGADETERRNAVYETFHSSQIYPTRYRLTVAAPAEVVNDSENVFRFLRRIRNTLADGLDLADAEYTELHQAHENALRRLRNSMRVDLGSSALVYSDDSSGALASPDGPPRDRTPR